MQKIFYVVFIWILFYVVHSILASQVFKDRILRVSSLTPHYYRITYSMIALLTFIVAIWFQNQFEDQVLIDKPTQYLKTISLIFTTLGVVIFRNISKQMSFTVFLGIKKSMHASNESKPEELNTKGIYSRLRHPIYTGSLCILMGFLAFKPTLFHAIFLGVTILYLPFGIYFEEKKLIETFGEQYVKYKRKVPAIIPKSFKLS